MNQNEVQSEVKRSAIESVFRDHRIWWLAVVGILGAIFFHAKYSEAFPTAALDLSVPREQIAVKAWDWSRRLGYSKPKTINSTTFFEDESIKTFLEFEMGTERGGELMRSEIPVWMWISRFCREHEPEECSIFLAPDGRFLKFKHTVPNDLALPSMAHDDAEKMALDFIQKTANRPINGYKLVGDETITQLKRKDYRFIWENRKVDFKGARQRYRVEVDGNQVGVFSETLNLPEEWKRRYEKMRSYNTQLFNIANAFYNVLIAIATVVFLWAVTNHRVRWKTTMVYALLFALIQVLESFNNFPTIVSQYEPVKLGYNAYITDQVLTRLFAVAGLFVVGVIFAGTAEVIYRLSWPKRIAMENWFKPSALQSTELTKGLVVGHLAPMIYLGWVIAYYVLGKHIGFFTPLSVENYRALASSVVPAWSAVSLGFFASTHEEIVYRVVALNLSLKLASKLPFFAKNNGKNAAIAFWVCNLFQAAAWGFMHSTYPQQPSYARGLELTCSGLLFGWLFQTFGLMSVMVTHYLLDCYLDSRVLLDSAQPALAVTAIMAVSPFLLLMGYAFWRRKKVSGESDLSTLTNEHISSLQHREIVQDKEPPKSFEHQPVPAGHRRWFIIATVASVLLSIWSWQPLAVGRNVHLHVNRAQAEKIGDQAMRDAGQNPAEYQRVTWLVADAVGEELQYIWEKVGAETAVKYANLEDFGFTWGIRYFKPLQIGEYRDQLDGRGRQYSFTITASDDTPGASLSESEAIKLAENYVKKHRAEFCPLKFDSIEEIRREKRIDFRIFFQSPLMKVGDAPSKVQVYIIGDKVAEFRQGWELPDSWKDEYERKKFRDEVTNVISMVYRTLLVVLGLWWVIGLLRSGAIRWRLPLLISGVAFVLAIVTEWNGSIDVFKIYPTSHTLDTFVSQQVMDSLQKLLWTTVFTVVPAALALAVFRMVAPDTSIYAVLRVGFRPANAAERIQQRQLWLDAIVFGYGIAVMRWVLSIVTAGISAHVSPAVQMASLWAITHMANVYSPQLDVTIECLSRAVKESFTAAIFVGLYQKYIGTFRRALLAMLVLLLLQYCQERYWQDYLMIVGHSFLDWAVFFVFIAKFARRNIYAYFMYGVASEILTRLPILAFHGSAVTANELTSCLVALVVPIAWLVWLYSNKITPAPQAGSAEGAPSPGT